MIVWVNGKRRKGGTTLRIVNTNMENKKIKDILFESIKECKGETFEVDIGEYDKVIHSAHELEDIFEKKLNTQSKPKTK